MKPVPEFSSVQPHIIIIHAFDFDAKNHFVLSQILNEIKRKREKLGLFSQKVPTMEFKAFIYFINYFADVLESLNNNHLFVENFFSSIFIDKQEKENLLLEHI